LWQRRKPFINLVANLSTRNNSRVERGAYADFQERFPLTLPATRHLPAVRALNPGRDESTSWLA
jgi:hypothetical protein